MFHDIVRVADAGTAYLKNKLGRVLSREGWGDEKSVVEVNGWVRWALRERGKIVKKGEGHNVFTNTGREWGAMLFSLQLPDGTPYRSDRVAYIGVGTGVQPEDPSVTALVNPIAYSGANFLAYIDVAGTDFPLRPSRTTVRYMRLFTENEITVPGVTSVLISELGLFTNGNQNTFAVNPDPSIGRDYRLSAASGQSPLAYKGLGTPVEKTNALEFQVEWELRL